MVDPIEAPPALALEPLYLAHGARFASAPCGWRIPADFGDPAGEALALRRAVGWLDRSFVGRLEITGEDRQRFLHGFVTCEVKGLPVGGAVPGFLTNAQGRVLADFTLVVLADRLWLELPPGRSEAIRAHLEKYVLADRVALRSLAATSLFELVGPGVEAALTLLGLPTPERGQARSGKFAGAAVEVVARGLGRLPAAALWVPEAVAAALAAALFDSGASDLGPRAVGFSARDAVRVEEGVAAWGEDFGEENFPQENGREDAISYTKGCFLGQEIVARLHYRGQVARLLRGLRAEGAAVPAIGSPVLAEGREAGRLTSAVASPALGGAAIGLALLQRRACEPGTRIVLASGEAAEVVLPPFV